MTFAPIGLPAGVARAAKRTLPTPGMLPLGVAVGASLAFLRASYELRGFSNTETVEVGPLLVDIEEEVGRRVAAVHSRLREMEELLAAFDAERGTVPKEPPPTAQQGEGIR